MPERNITANTDEAAAKLRRVEEFTTELVSPLVAEFGRFLAGRVNPGRIVPMGFIIAANLSLYDLEKGINGFTGEPIRNDLVGRTPEVYALLTSSIPGLARIAFSEEFADAVDVEWLKVIGAVQAERRETLKPAEKPIDSDIYLKEKIDQSKRFSLLIPSNIVYQNPAK